MLQHVTRVGALLVALATAGCDESLSSLTGPTPQLKPAFSSIQAEIEEGAANN